MKSIFAALFFFWTHNLMAQESSIVLRWGLSTFSMKEQRNLQDDFRQVNRAIPFKAVHTFPIYYNFGAALAIKTSDKSAIGFWYEYNSTGGRLHYKDYSGYAFFDQTLNSSQFGGFYQYALTASGKWSILATGHLSVVFTNEKVDFAINIGPETEAESYGFKSSHLGIRPGILFQRKLNLVLFQCGMGYDLQTRGKLTTQDDLYLTDSNGSEISAQWDGLRVFLGLGITLKK